MKVSASTSSMVDVGFSGACTGIRCCLPGCQISIGDFHGCNSNVVFAGSCDNSFRNPTSTLHPSACDDVQVTLVRDPDGNPSYDL